MLRNGPGNLSAEAQERNDARGLSPLLAPDPRTDRQRASGPTLLSAVLVRGRRLRVRGAADRRGRGDLVRRRRVGPQGAELGGVCSRTAARSGKLHESELVLVRGGAPADVAGQVQTAGL